jgi:hypothetical protein
LPYIPCAESIRDKTGNLYLVASIKDWCAHARRWRAEDSARWSRWGLPWTSRCGRLRTTISTHSGSRSRSALVGQHAPARRCPAVALPALAFCSSITATTSADGENDASAEGFGNAPQAAERRHVPLFCQAILPALPLPMALAVIDCRWHWPSFRPLPERSFVFCVSGDGPGVRRAPAPSIAEPDAVPFLQVPGCTTDIVLETSYSRR